jgi:putative transposase
VLLTFYDFPAEQWLHIRTTNPIERVFSTVRLRHTKTKGSGTRPACLTMVFKLMENASNSLHVVNCSPLLKDMISGVTFRGRSEETRRLKNLHPRKLTIPRVIGSRL